jgi:hypothetical protein
MKHSESELHATHCAQAESYPDRLVIGICLRDLPFLGGKAVGYCGMTIEEALQCITSNAARIPRIKNTIETPKQGKDKKHYRKRWKYSRY